MSGVRAMVVRLLILMLALLAPALANAAQLDAVARDAVRVSPEIGEREAEFIDGYHGPAGERGADFRADAALGPGP